MSNLRKHENREPAAAWSAAVQVPALRVPAFGEINMKGKTSWTKEEWDKLSKAEKKKLIAEMVLRETIYWKAIYEAIAS